MQEKFILLWSSSALLWLPRRYTATVSLCPTWQGRLSSDGLSVTVCLRPAGGCVLSVAVVNNSTLDVRSLRGLRSCHSGVRWTAGWSLPLGFLLSRNYLSWSKEQPLHHGNQSTISRRVLKSTVVPWRFSPPEQTSATFSVPAAFLEPLPSRHTCALCARARSPTSARRTTTAKRPTLSPSTTTKGPSGEPPQWTLQLAVFQIYRASTAGILNVSVASFVLSQMSQEWSSRCCFCGPFSAWKHWRSDRLILFFQQKELEPFNENQRTVTSVFSPLCPPRQWQRWVQVTLFRWKSSTSQPLQKL